MNTSHGPVQQDLTETSTDTPSLAHIFNVIRSYSAVIVLVVLSVAILYLLGAVIIYLLSPSSRVTSAAFRLEFEGAAQGRYPNDLRFSPSEIVATPILLHVYKTNNLGAYLKFEAFSRSFAVTESNREYEKLSDQYRARLSDPRLSPVDRERIEREFEQRVASISKHGYAIQYLHAEKRLPETLVRKVLADVLNRWAWVAVNEQHVLRAETSILSEGMVGDPRIREGDLIAGIQILRSRVSRVLANVQRLQQLPGAKLARTSDQLSLEEVATRLDEMVRFQLEPLVTTVRSTDLEDPSATLQFLKNQLAYDERQLRSARERAEAIRETLAVYSREQRTFTSPGAATRPLSPSGSQQPGAETVMPQLSDTFLDRLVSLTSDSVDAKYRQQLAEEYRNALRDAIPLEEAVAYDRQIIEQIQSPAFGRGRRDAIAIRNELGEVQEELRTLVGKVGELYEVISRNMYPTAQLLTVTAPPVSRVHRAVSLKTLGLYGVLLLLLSLPLSIIGVLLHNRMREEEQAEDELMTEQAEGL